MPSKSRTKVDSQCGTRSLSSSSIIIIIIIIIIRRRRRRRRRRRYKIINKVLKNRFLLYQKSFKIFKTDADRPWY